MLSECRCDLDTSDEVETVFGLPISENRAPLILVWSEDRGGGDESFHYEEVFNSLAEAELAFQVLEHDPACNEVIACWRDGSPDPRLDYIPL